jgi:hypothetical protein
MAEPSEGASGPAFSVRLKNTSGEPLSLQTRFDASGIVSVRRLDGEIDPASWNEPASLPWPMTTYLLPRGGMIGREFDLGCMRPDFSPAVTPCYSVHDWEPGEYEFKFEFGEFGFCRVRPCDPENVEDWQMPFYTESGFKIDPIRMRLRARSGWEVMP